MRFREAGRRAGATLHELPLAATGPAGESLAIDVAWLGARAPRRVLLQTSGIHGVEAYAGSAVQLALLDTLPVIPVHDALVLVHVLNPYGMAWTRRTNENNVDLNRNFLTGSDSWSGAPSLYRKLDPLLNPASPPAFDAFTLRAAGAALRHGFAPLKQAIAEGQYEYPRGLFFGGRELQPGPRIYLDWLRAHLAKVQHLFALDVHTGLGRWGEDTVLLESGVGATPVRELQAALRRPLVNPASGRSVAYTVRGGLGSALPVTLPATSIDFVLQELGTYSPLAMFRALREENRCHFYGGGPDHPAKQRLREASCPAAPAWRDSAVAHGTALARAAALWVFR
jgi:hypothetical protein